MYGSLRDPSFVPGRSDVDCIAVTWRPLDDRTFAVLQRWSEDAAHDDPSFSRLQISFLVKDRVLEDDPLACLYQFGDLTRSGSDGNPIIWLDFFQRGVILWGPDPHSFVPPITGAVFHAALVREIGYLNEEIILKAQSEWRPRPSYRAYAVLTLCRILYSGATGRVTSKTKAAVWALANAPDAFHDLIREAEQTSNNLGSADLALPSIANFINYVQSHINRDSSSSTG